MNLEEPIPPLLLAKRRANTRKLVPDSPPSKHEKTKSSRPYKTARLVIPPFSGGPEPKQIIQQPPTILPANISRSSSNESINTAKTSLPSRGLLEMAVEEENDPENIWKMSNQYNTLLQIKHFFHNRYDIPTILIAIHKSSGIVEDAIRRLNSGDCSCNVSLLMQPIISDNQDKIARYYA